MVGDFAAFFGAEHPDRPARRGQGLGSLGRRGVATRDLDPGPERTNTRFALRQKFT